MDSITRPPLSASERSATSEGTPHPAASFAKRSLERLAHDRRIAEQSDARDSARFAQLVAVLVHFEESWARLERLTNWSLDAEIERSLIRCDLLRDPRVRMRERPPYGERVRRGALLEKQLVRDYPTVERKGSTVAIWAEFIESYLGALARCAGKLEGSEKGTPVRQVAVHYFATNLVFEAPDV